MSKTKNGGLDQYGKVQSLNGIGGERVKPIQPASCKKTISTQKGHIVTLNTELSDQFEVFQ